MVVAMSRAQAQAADLVVCESRDDRRIIVSLPGRYSLDDGAIVKGERRLYACRAVNVSMRGLAVTAPVTAKVGVAVSADIDGLGRLKGIITREFRQGFVMSIVASDEERELLATKIDWLEMNKNLEIPDDRAHARFIPRRPHSLLMLPDGSMLPCFVIDISVSGAAVSADFAPKIGTVLAVGSVVGRVVRFFPGGFAIQFNAVQERLDVEALVIRR
jgi:hypothetical protein